MSSSSTPRNSSISPRRHDRPQRRTRDLIAIRDALTAEVADMRAELTQAQAMLEKERDGHHRLQRDHTELRRRLDEERDLHRQRLLELRAEHDRQMDSELKTIRDRHAARDRKLAQMERDELRHEVEQSTSLRLRANFNQQVENLRANHRARERLWSSERETLEKQLSKATAEWDHYKKRYMAAEDNNGRLLIRLRKSFSHQNFLKKYGVLLRYLAILSFAQKWRLCTLIRRIHESTREFMAKLKLLADLVLAKDGMRIIREQRADFSLGFRDVFDKKRRRARRRMAGLHAERKRLAIQASMAASPVHGEAKVESVDGGGVGTGPAHLRHDSIYSVLPYDVREQLQGMDGEGPLTLLTLPARRSSQEASTPPPPPPSPPRNATLDPSEELADSLISHRKGQSKASVRGAKKQRQHRLAGYAESMPANALHPLNFAHSQNSADASDVLEPSRNDAYFMSQIEIHSWFVRDKKFLPKMRLVTNKRNRVDLVSHICDVSGIAQSVFELAYRKLCKALQLAHVLSIDSRNKVLEVQAAREEAQSLRDQAEEVAEAMSELKAKNQQLLTEKEACTCKSGGSLNEKIKSILDAHDRERRKWRRRFVGLRRQLHLSRDHVRQARECYRQAFRSVFNIMAAHGFKKAYCAVVLPSAREWDPKRRIQPPVSEPAIERALREMSETDSVLEPSRSHQESKLHGGDEEESKTQTTAGALPDITAELDDDSDWLGGEQHPAPPPARKRDRQPWRGPTVTEGGWNRQHRSEDYGEEGIALHTPRHGLGGDGAARGSESSPYRTSGARRVSAGQRDEDNLHDNDDENDSKSNNNNNNNNSSNNNNKNSSNSSNARRTGSKKKPGARRSTLASRMRAAEARARIREREKRARDAIKNRRRRAAGGPTRTSRATSKPRKTAGDGRVGSSVGGGGASRGSKAPVLSSLSAHATHSEKTERKRQQPDGPKSGDKKADKNSNKDKDLTAGDKDCETQPASSSRRGNADADASGVRVNGATQANSPRTSNTRTPSNTTAPQNNAARKSTSPSTRQRAPLYPAVPARSAGRSNPNNNNNSTHSQHTSPYKKRSPPQKHRSQRHTHAPRPLPPPEKPKTPDMFAQYRAAMGTPPANVNALAAVAQEFEEGLALDGAAAGGSGTESSHHRHRSEHKSRSGAYVQHRSRGSGAVSVSRSTQHGRSHSRSRQSQGYPYKASTNTKHRTSRGFVAASPKNGRASTPLTDTVGGAL